MDSSSVYSIVLAEIKNEHAFENLHGIDYNNIKDYLVMPYQMEFINPIDENIEKHWVVLDEDMNDQHGGYLIFFSSINNMFGLAIKGNNKGHTNTGTNIGFFGSFIETLNAM